MIDLLARWKPATVNNRYRGCQAFFRWCVDEEIIDASPMAKMKPPKVPEQPVPVLRLEDDRRLTRPPRRARALTTSAMRRSCASSTPRGSASPSSRTCAGCPTIPSTNDVDLDQQVLRVIGKGGRSAS